MSLIFNSNTIINYCKHCGLESTAQNINIIEDVEKLLTFRYSYDEKNLSSTPRDIAVTGLLVLNFEWIRFLFYSFFKLINVLNMIFFF